MERFTNNTEALFHHIQKELLDVATSEENAIRFTYLELSNLLRFGHSVSGFADDPSRLLVKVWDASYDWDRFRTGVYNLDRLAIYEHTVKLDKTEVQQLHALLNKELALVAFKGIILDGYTCALSTKKEKLEWNSGYGINANIEAFVTFLRAKFEHVLA
jgi:hypothetical protein